LSGFGSASIVPLNVFDNILPMMLYFVLGYVFYVSIFVGIGWVCSTDRSPADNELYKYNFNHAVFSH